MPCPFCPDPDCGTQQRVHLLADELLGIICTRAKEHELGTEEAILAVASVFTTLCSILDTKDHQVRATVTALATKFMVTGLTQLDPIAAKVSGLDKEAVNIDELLRRHTRETN